MKEFALLNFFNYEAKDVILEGCKGGFPNTVSLKYSLYGIKKNQERIATLTVQNHVYCEENVCERAGA